MSTRRRLEHKVALITGGGSGIGEATAKQLAREGARVAVADIDQAAALRVSDEIRAAGGRSQAVALDVQLTSSWLAAFESVVEQFGPVSVLVNSAGVSSAARVVDTTLEDWRRVHAVNLDGVFLGTREAIRDMSSRGGGVIVNLASRAGIDVHPGAAAYASSKAAVIHFSKVAAKECAADGIRVHVLAPGGVRTAMWKSTPFWAELAAESEAALWAKLDPQGEFESAEDVAGSILELILAE